MFITSCVFKETSNYKLKAINVNAFEKVIVHISEGNLQIENIEIDSDLYEGLDDMTWRTMMPMIYKVYFDY